MRFPSSLPTGAAFLVLWVAAFPAHAATPVDTLATFENAARQADAGFKGFSPQRGEQFFNATHGNDWSCASCHTSQPTSPGKHAKTGKSITPLAPAANSERFADIAKTEKWFKRNCNDVLGRACTPQEKGDVLIYLMSLRR